MMEREWRWALPYDRLGVPGIPFFLSDNYANFFSEIYIIVSTDNELTDITNYLKTLYDSVSTNTGIEYNVRAIESAKIISLESISKLNISDNIKIESIPFEQIHIPTRYKVSQEEESKITTCFNAAFKKADEAIEKYLNDHPDFNVDKGFWGFVNVTVYGYNKVVEVLRKQNKAKSYSDGKYYLGQMSSCKSMNINLLEVGASAAADYLTKELDEGFFVETRLD